jgi:DNA polymerase elongation subunit (family B)
VKKIQKDNIINGKIEEVIDEKTVTIKTDTCLEEGEVIKYIKRGICKSQLIEINMISLEDATDDSFTGATVLEPKKGLYLDDIMVLDFASLYPTIMISRNLCFSSLVDLTEWSEERLKSEGIKYEVIDWEDTVSYKLNKKCEKIMSGGKREGELCGKEASVKVDRYNMYYCDNHKTERSNEQTEQTCDKIVKGSICNKVAKWSDGISDYCERCKKNDEDKEIEFTSISYKCEICGRKAKSSECIEKDSYFCLIHDPYKSTRNEEEKRLEKDVYYRYVIVQPDEGRNKGVVPSLLEDLYKARKDVKKQMFQAKEDKLLKDILDMQQLAIKISLNSVYGFMGRTKGNLVKGELGRLTTAVGRKLINTSKDFVEEDYDKKIKGKLKCCLQAKEISEERKNEIKQLLNKDFK